MQNLISYYLKIQIKKVDIILTILIQIFFYRKILQKRSKTNQMKMQPSSKILSLDDSTKVVIRLIKQYPFSLASLNNIMQLSYTCFASQKLCKILKIENIGYRIIKDQIQQTHVVLIVRNNSLKNSFKQQDHKKTELKIQQSQMLAHEQANDDSSQNEINSSYINHQQNQLFVPFNIYKKLLNSNYKQKKSQQELQNIKVVIQRFPISIDENACASSVFQQAQTITITNISQSNAQLRDLITKIIYLPKTSKFKKQALRQSQQEKQKFQRQFLIFPTLKNNKIIIDMRWIGQNNFVRQLKTFKIQNKINRLNLQNNKIKQQSNKLTNYFQFSLKYKSKKLDEHLNSQSQQKNLSQSQQKNLSQSQQKNLSQSKQKALPIIVKFVPGKTKIQFQPTMDLIQQPFYTILKVSKLYDQIYSSHEYYIKLSQRIKDSIASNKNINSDRLICIRSDKSIGMRTFFNSISQNYLNYRFVMIDCQNFITKNQFENALKNMVTQGNCLIFIKNLTWIQHLIKNDDIVPDNMKNIIQKTYQTLKLSYKNTFKHFICVIYLSQGEMPQQLPWNTLRIEKYLQKQQKITIIKDIFCYFRVYKQKVIDQKIEEVITNMLINSVGWTKLFKFLISTFKKSNHLIEKQIVSQLKTKFSLQKVQNILEVSWSDIGGLQTAKQQIIQTVLLPSSHPQIFDQLIKPRTGLLFYGPPGTGKTLLGKCIAKQCKMGFISVKGPQLLNMYVGESQKNVRQVFQRAKNSKPCIVFMDQLDALIPKRGNSSDSNQVMDRIVAELLTQMDQASQNQIFIIGATNRPDLLDPSILRAGRFDKQIYLGISKNKQDRVKILKAQTRNSKLQKQFNYQLIIEKVPQNFTGADFYGLTSKSMMRAVQRSIHLYESGENNDPDVVITEEDFLQVINTVKPSVTLQELAHYETLKQKFS